ncbi:MAG: hypothetical protein HY453_01320 [Parcubacteria group bacterium]|nr:hypothetical protein [Parcubacteria group bacterium]
MNQEKIKIALKIVENIENEVAMVRKLLASDLSHEDMDVSKLSLTIDDKDLGKSDASVIEGIFDGTKMIGDDGKEYSMSANYASKSKLVEGDRLKLSIGMDGSFIYKQIKPIDRDRLRGMLARDEETGEYHVIVGKSVYRVLLASITYFRGKPGDEVVILVPRERGCVWAAVENIISKPIDAEAELGL